MFGKIWDRVQREPVVFWNAVVALVEALLVLVVLFGADLSEAQQAGIISALVALGGVFAALMGRSKVSPIRRQESKTKSSHWVGP